MIKDNGVIVDLRVYKKNERLFIKGFIMGISSLGVGSGILTQSLLDKLRTADEASQVKPTDLNIVSVKDKQASYSLLDATMTNLTDSITAMKTQSLFDERKATVTGTSVSVIASANSDKQSFTLNVTQLATKQIEESGSFAVATDKIASAAGSVDLAINGKNFTVNYDATTTIDDFKKAINTAAGTDVNATIVQVATGDFRLFATSANTGTTQDITITDTTGNLLDTRLTTGLTAIQTGVDANFDFNGQAITRTSNNVTDLITGYDITLNELGSSTVKVEQNKDSILAKVDSFISKYNDAVKELNKYTKVSSDSTTRGIFSTDSSIKALRTTVNNLVKNVGGGVGSLLDYGFDVTQDGTMSVDKTVLNTKLDANPTNFKSFFTGGDYTDAAGTVTTLKGAFVEMSTSVEAYTAFNGMLDQFNTSLSDNLKSLEDRRVKAVERLDSKYSIMKKQFAAYDAVINRLNSTSSLLTQLTNSKSGQ